MELMDRLLEHKQDVTEATIELKVHVRERGRAIRISRLAMSRSTKRPQP